MPSTFKHVLPQHEVFPPDVDNVIGKGTPGWAIVIETGNAAIDVECRGVEHSPLQTVNMTPNLRRRSYTLIRDSSEALSKGLPLRVVMSCAMFTSFFRLGTSYRR